MAIDATPCAWNLRIKNSYAAGATPKPQRGHGG